MLWSGRGRDYRRRQDGRVVGSHYTSKEKTPALTSGRVGPAMGLCDAGASYHAPARHRLTASCRGRPAKHYYDQNKNGQGRSRERLTSLPTPSGYTTKTSCAGCRTSPKIAPRLVRIWLAIPNSQEGLGVLQNDAAAGSFFCDRLHNFQRKFWRRLCPCGRRFVVGQILQEQAPFRVSGSNRRGCERSSFPQSTIARVRVLHTRSRTEVGCSRTFSWLL